MRLIGSARPIQAQRLGHGVLGETGEETQVFRVHENGEPSPVWNYGRDAYPPNS